MPSAFFAEDGTRNTPRVAASTLRRAVKADVADSRPVSGEVYYLVPGTPLPPLPAKS
jgi:hypothetical protein